MADIERLLIAKVIADRDITAIIDGKITDDFFLDEEHLGVLGWMREHFTEHGSSPSEQALKANYPTYRLPETPEPMGWYLAEIRKKHRYEVLSEAVQEAAYDLEEEKLDAASRRLQKALDQSNADISPLRDHELTDPEEFDKIWDYYASLTDNPGSLRGISSGWPTIDLATMGFQPGQLITMVGPPKGGKSTVMLSACDAVALGGHDALMVSFEMSYDEMAARWVGQRVGINYRRLLKGKMNETDELRFQKLMARLKKSDSRLVLSDDISATTTVSGIIAKIQLHKPRVVFIDGVYLMDDEHGEPKGSAAAITNITRSLKRVAQVFGITIVISTQTLFSKMKGQSIKAASIGYSSSFGQDSDVVLAAEPREAEDGSKEYFLKILLSRSGPNIDVQINFDWETSNFEEYAASQGPIEDPDEEDDGQIRLRALRSA